MLTFSEVQTMHPEQQGSFLASFVILLGYRLVDYIVGLFTHGKN
jgi:hypothetical protein